jgi:hypothetical protein
MLAYKRWQCFYYGKMSGADIRPKIDFLPEHSEVIAALGPETDATILQTGILEGPIELIEMQLARYEVNGSVPEVHLTSIVELAKRIAPDSLARKLQERLPEYWLFDPIGTESNPHGVRAITGPQEGISSILFPLTGGSRWSINSALRFESTDFDIRVYHTTELLRQHLGFLHALVQVVFEARDNAQEEREVTHWLTPPSEKPAEAEMVDPFGEFIAIDGLIQELRDFALLANIDPDELVREGIEPMHAVMLYGPSGVGKTAAMRALAGALGAKEEYVSLKEASGKYVGEWGTKIENIFETAYKKKRRRTLIIMDEWESLILSGNPQVTANITGVLKRQLEKIKNYPHVFFACATNAPEDIDPVLRAKKRLPLQLYFPEPTDAQRAAFFQKFLIQDRLAALSTDDPAAVDTLNGYEYDFAGLAKAAPDFTASDIQEALSDMRRSRYLQAKRNKTLLAIFPTQEEVIHALQRARQTKA